MNMIEAAAQLATALAALFGVYVAAKGVGTWREELRGRAKYGTARQILRAVYQVRNGVWLVRASSIREGEMRAAESGAQSPDRADLLRAVHDRRWGAVSEPMGALEVALLDGEVLWGSSLSDAFQDLRQVIHELGLNVHYYLEGLADPALQRARGAEGLEQIGAVAIATGTPAAPDAFQSRIDSIIRRIEALLRPHVE